MGVGCGFQSARGVWAVRRRENRKNSPFLSDYVRGLARKRPRFDLECDRKNLVFATIILRCMDESGTGLKLWHGICTAGGGERQFKVPGSKFQVTDDRQPAFGGLQRAVTLNFELETRHRRVNLELPLTRPGFVPARRDYAVAGGGKAGWGGSPSVQAEGLGQHSPGQRPGNAGGKRL